MYSLYYKLPQTFCIKQYPEQKQKSNIDIFIIEKLTFCIWETPKWVLLQTMKTQMKCDMMWHIIRVYTIY